MALVKFKTSILEDFFRISELKNSQILATVSLSFYLSFIISFDGWLRSNSSNYTCSSHVFSCELFRDLLIFQDFPVSYFQNYFFIGLLGVIVLGLYSLYKKDYENVWYTILILGVVKFLYVFAFGGGNYDYYDLLLLLVFLFAHNKLFFLRVFYVFFYFLAATIKFHEGWIIGTYFTAMQTGLPIFPDFTTPIWTNFVILTQIFLCWGLLFSKRKYFFIAAEIFFLAFHFYSGFLVEYRYLLTTLPMMLVLFILPEKVTYRQSKNIFVSVLAVLMVVGQFIAIIIPGDQKLTLEGNKYGLYMFEANHQCVTRVDVERASGEITPWNYYSQIARDRCDPYAPFARFKEFCGKDIRKATMTHDHSINGSPFYRIVDGVDICKVEYNSFTRNDWIKNENDNPLIVGKPVKNYYDGRATTSLTEPKRDGELLILPSFEKNDQIFLHPIQKWLLPYNSALIIFYWICWSVMSVVAIYLLVSYCRRLNGQSSKKEIQISLK